MHDMLRISFRPATVTQLERHLRRAIQVGDARRIKHISALLSLADGLTVSTIAERLGVARTTVYTWLHAFLVDGWDSLTYRKPLKNNCGGIADILRWYCGYSAVVLQIFCGRAKHLV